MFRTPLDVIRAWLATHRLADPMNIPSIVWPEDRRWCVVTPFQFSSTYVAGSADLIGKLLDPRDRIDVRVASLDDEL